MIESPKGKKQNEVGIMTMKKTVRTIILTIVLFTAAAGSFTAAYMIHNAEKDNPVSTEIEQMI